MDNKLLLKYLELPLSINYIRFKKPIISHEMVIKNYPNLNDLLVDILNKQYTFTYSTINKIIILWTHKPMSYDIIDLLDKKYNLRGKHFFELYILFFDYTVDVMLHLNKPMTIEHIRYWMQNTSEDYFTKHADVIIKTDVDEIQLAKLFIVKIQNVKSCCFKCNVLFLNTCKQLKDKIFDEEIIEVLDIYINNFASCDCYN